MHPELAEYLQCIDPDDLGNLEAVEASWLEAQRIMSPQGLENYLVRTHVSEEIKKEERNLHKEKLTGG